METPETRVETPETRMETPHDISGGLATHVEKSEKGKENFEKGKGRKGKSHRTSAVEPATSKYSTL